MTRMLGYSVADLAWLTFGEIAASLPRFDEDDHVIVAADPESAFQL